jgi:hypothetical protein
MQIEADLSSWVDSSTQALVAQQAEEPELTLFWYEETKAAMNFDPQLQPEVPMVRLDWRLWEEHPVSLEEFMRNLAVTVEPENPTDFLYRQSELAQFIKRMEEREDEHLEPPAGTDPDSHAGGSGDGGGDEDSDVVVAQGDDQGE